MANILDRLQDYFRGFGQPLVVRGGPGYVAEQEDPSFKPKANVEDIVQEEPVATRLLDSFRNINPFKLSVSGQRDPAQVQKERLAMVDKMRAQGWQTPEEYSSNQVQVSSPPMMDDYSPPSPSNSNAYIDPNARDYLESTLLPLTRQYGIPDELAAAQWAIEGGRSTSGIQATNPLGLLWEGEIHPYQSLENAVADYDRTLRDIVSYNTGMSDQRFSPNDNFSYGDYTPEELAWYLMFTELEDRRAPEGNPLYGDPNASLHRYEAHSPTPDYVSLLMNTPEWQYYSQY